MSDDALFRDKLKHMGKCEWVLGAGPGILPGMEGRWEWGSRRRAGSIEG